MTVIHRNGSITRFWSTLTSENSLVFWNISFFWQIATMFSKWIESAKEKATTLISAGKTVLEEVCSFLLDYRFSR